MPKLLKDSPVSKEITQISTEKFVRLRVPIYLQEKDLDTFEDEAKIQVEIFGNEEFKEGVSAFFAKRKPNFQK